MIGLIVQRIFLCGGLIGAYFLFDFAVGLTRNGGGLPGVWLLSGSDPTVAVGAVISAVFAASCLGVLAGFWQKAHALTGILIYSGALTWLMLKQGGTEPWLRSYASRSDYLALAGEALVWGGVTWVACRFVVGVWMMWHGVARSMPGTISDEQGITGGRPLVWFDSKKHGQKLRDEVVAAATAVTGGLALCFLLVRTAEAKQIVWGVFFAFAITGSLVHSYMPHASVRGLLLSPMVAAVLGYLLVAVVGPFEAEALRAFMGSEFKAMGMILPVHYASAGVAGVTSGVIWSYLASVQAASAAMAEGAAPPESATK